MTTIPLAQASAEDAPVACTLTPSEYEDRASELSELAARALTHRAPIDGGQRLSFVDVPAVERQLRAAVDAESSCCSFLSLRLARTDGTLVVDITGPVQAQPIIAELFA
jgi:hypothetical protein